MATVTRADLSKAVLREIGLSRRESAECVDSIIEAIADRLEAGGGREDIGVRHVHIARQG